MVPTAHALELQKKIHDVLFELRQLLQPAKRHDFQTASGSIKIACADATALFALGALVERIREVAPNVQLEIYQIANLRVREPLEEGLVDLALGAYLEPSDVLLTCKVADDETVCVVSNDNAYSKSGITLDQYCSSPHAVLSVGFGYRATIEVLIDRALADQERSRTVRLKSQYSTVIADAVSRSDLITTMPCFAFNYFAKRMAITAVPLPFDAPMVPLSILWHPRTRDNWVTAWFRQEIRDHIATIRPRGVSRAEASSAGSPGPRIARRRGRSART
jgi:DNA-binding transcriptional LysR family regulator